MRLDDFLEYEVDDDAERRRLAEEKSYELLDHLESFEHRFAEATDGGSSFGSVSPAIFVGTANYPNVSTGILSPVGREGDAARYETSGAWYEEGVSISDVFERRTSLLNANQSVERNVHEAARAADTSTRRDDDGLPNVHDAWNGFLGTQREVAIADRPVDVEVALADGPDVDFDPGRDDISTPTGPRAAAADARLGENPHVPPAVEKTLEDDDWRAEGAINYLYNRGFDVYEINTILSAGALGRADERRLVPTRWSITAVDDTVGQFLRGSIRTNTSVDTVEVYHDSYLGNEFFVLLAPGSWEYELVEAKAPGSIWNPDNEEAWYASDREGREGRTSYPEETAGAYHAARLGVLEHLAERGRSGKALVVRYVSPDYWGPAGVWQVRESVRHAFEGRVGEAETLAEAVRRVADRLPVPLTALRQKSTMVAGLQSTLSAFDARTD
ncbi:hypothetical protein RYH80_07520 [Halobaculum sp. MBLA0147]|uniref:hypothetical protein n=1 Tax=Halobaculum sp. MBLA0147 TaxID=3079934 RepID=UPI003523225F